MIITEKNDVIRTGLKAAIEETDIAEVIGDYASVGEMLPYLKSLTPDVVILGGSGNILNRCLACYEIQSASPTTKTLTLTEEQRDDELRHLILSGASGCVTTSAGGAEIARSVGMVADGGMSFDNAAIVRLVGRIRIGRAATSLPRSTISRSESVPSYRWLEKVAATKKSHSD